MQDMNNGSGVNREVPAPFCEGLGVKLPRSTLPEALLLSPMELIERLVALIPPPCFHMTRYFGVLASASKHRNELPDLPKGSVDSESEYDGVPSKKGKRRGKRRICLADLLRRTFRVDVLGCPACGGRFELIGLVLDRPTITATLMAVGLPARAPPIAPAHRNGLFGVDCVDSYHADTEADPG